LRLKGAMYEESFRADQGLRERIEEAVGVYQNGIRKRKEYLQSRYSRYAYDAERPLHQAPELGLVDTSKSVDTATHSSDMVHVSKRLQSSRGDQDTGRQLYGVQRSEGQKQRPDDVSNGVAENDRTRATITTSLRELTTRLRSTVSGLVTKYVRTATESRKPREYDHYEQQYKQQGLNAISADRSSERYDQSL
jgi:hypothetical protein